jgi:hypothetical protein
MELFGLRQIIWITCSRLAAQLRCERTATVARVLFPAVVVNAIQRPDVRATELDLGLRVVDNISADRTGLQRPLAHRIQDLTVAFEVGDRCSMLGEDMHHNVTDIDCAPRCHEIRRCVEKLIIDQSEKA